ncbi:hypothetical protein BESB_067480 [Besnoitia besnoiti]|uniref:Uncharacterized protein n=1 Tax=Besnoitia besnoiti TaxID=94643 RepID=A0A2A9M9N9_BESBE|nr:hypothetical protein BESB_067480 [Besnoitia besnoiti]PFH34715.1 hypothetical protein BESB_067480 [Besnoitia besnoiti]
MTTSVDRTHAMSVPDRGPRYCCDLTDYAGKPSSPVRPNINGELIDDACDGIFPEHRRPRGVHMDYAGCSGMAGVEAGRMTEIQQHTRKRIDPAKGSSDGVKQLLSYTGAQYNERYPTCFEGERTEAGMPTYPAVRRSKRSHLRVCGGDLDEQRRHFQTRWQAIDGKMEFCTCRKGGSASVEINYKQLDRDATYHTWKRMLGAYDRTARSHLQCDRFLTVETDAKRSDRLPDVKNREPPFANPDGPFEKRDTTRPAVEASSLDRTLCPRKGEKTADDKVSGKASLPASIYLRSSHLATSSLAPQLGAKPRQHYRTAEYSNMKIEDSVSDILRGTSVERKERRPPQQFSTESPEQSPLQREDIHSPSFHSDQMDPRDEHRANFASNNHKAVAEESLVA